MRSRLVCFALLYNLLSLTVSGQQVFTIRGIVTSKETGDRISQVQVHDLRSNAFMMSDEFGVFSIKAATDDTLQFSKPGYTVRELAIFNSADVVVELQNEIVLKEIVIKDKTIASEQNAAIANYREKGLYFDGSPPLAIFNPISGSPLTGLHELLGKDAANERHFIGFIRDDEQAAYIDNRFTSSLVKSITHLPENEITGFMDACRPGYSDLKTWSDYQLQQYIKTAFVKWQKKK